MLKEGFLFLRRNPLSTQLFSQGLQTENNGHFEEATALYENALVEVKKSGFILYSEKKHWKIIAIGDDKKGLQQPAVYSSKQLVVTSVIFPFHTVFK